MKHVHNQMQYRFAVIYETLSMFLFYLLHLYLLAIEEGGLGQGCEPAVSLGNFGFASYHTASQFTNTECPRNLVHLHIVLDIW